VLEVSSLLGVVLSQLKADSRDLPPLRRIFSYMIDCTGRLLRITIQAEYDKEEGQPANQTSHILQKRGPPQVTPVPRRAYFGESGACCVSRPALHDKVRTSTPLHFPSTHFETRHATHSHASWLTSLAPSPSPASLSLASCTASCT
jgi:hypothetical protein